eukprot:3458125-Prymnesium_polylepis.1
MVGASVHNIGAVRRRLPPLRQRWRRLTLTRLSRYAHGSVTTGADGGSPNHILGRRIGTLHGMIDLS